jgi:hypothetical protein
MVGAEDALCHGMEPCFDMSEKFGEGSTILTRLRRRNAGPDWASER